jgi:hypothetical protein
MTQINQVATWRQPSGKPCDLHKHPRVSVMFPADEFAMIREIAEKNGVSFGEMVRQLVRRGLQSW